MFSHMRLNPEDESIVVYLHNDERLPLIEDGDVIPVVEATYELVIR